MAWFLSRHVVGPPPATPALGPARLPGSTPQNTASIPWAIPHHVHRSCREQVLLTTQSRRPNPWVHRVSRHFARGCFMGAALSDDDFMGVPAPSRGPSRREVYSFSPAGTSLALRSPPASGAPPSGGSPPEHPGSGAGPGRGAGDPARDIAPGAACPARGPETAALRPRLGRGETPGQGSGERRRSRRAGAQSLEDDVELAEAVVDLVSPPLHQARVPSCARAPCHMRIRARGGVGPFRLHDRQTKLRHAISMQAALSRTRGGIGRGEGPPTSAEHELPALESPPRSQSDGVPDRVEATPLRTLARPLLPPGAAPAHTPSPLRPSNQPAKRRLSSAKQAAPKPAPRTDALQDTVKEALSHFSCPICHVRRGFWRGIGAGGRGTPRRRGRGRVHARKPAQAPAVPDHPLRPPQEVMAHCHVLRCSHWFCGACLARWFQARPQNRQCPMCR